MDNKERWDAAARLFLSIGNVAVVVMKNPNNETESWSVVKVGRYSDGRKYILVENMNGNGNTRVVEMEEFISHVVFPPPEREPAKSEAEELWETVGYGDAFWITSNDGWTVRWVVSNGVNSGINTVQAHVAGYPKCVCFNFGRSSFIEGNATATRPKTERERELEDTLGGTECTLKNAELRVKELEDTEQGLKDIKGGIREFVASYRENQKDKREHFLKHEGEIGEHLDVLEEGCKQ